MSALRIRVVARVGSSARLSPFVIGSLAVHAVLVAAMILLPALDGRTAIPDHPLVVNLVAPVRSASSVQAAPAPPTPTPTKKPEGVHVETKKPKPAPKKKPKPAPKEELPDPGPPTPPVANPAPGEPGGAPMGPSGPVGDSITAFEGGGVELAWYRSQVTAALYSNWRKPVLQGAREPIDVRVTFDIVRDGSVRNLRVEIPSGVPSLDRSALRAVTDAAPLPPIPPSWRDPILPAGFVFRLHPE